MLPSSQGLFKGRWLRIYLFIIKITVKNGFSRLFVGVYVGIGMSTCWNILSWPENVDGYVSPSVLPAVSVGSVNSFWLQRKIIVTSEVYCDSLICEVCHFLNLQITC